ncbi:hypothetical protein CRV00_09270 [Malaciobacter molluscorum]|uniref:class I SAM-dependent methyltransferase n=1 Tax=Malaciobacter molluscorum TaxID=1032072 RepID=UPI00100A9920|nr:class I SAM-dependent methyltransferase [Malaciobacter molluscorum]RXJ93850.1 hypothetical protein CRV00_09270 [Malaciobacter molluscorum]
MICPNCNSTKTITIYKNKKMPYGLNLKEKTIDIEVEYCQECKFIFQSSAYTNNYNKNILELYKSYTISNMYNFPNTSQTNIKALKFISPYIKDEINFNILEIGSNRGDFLYLLKQKFTKVNILGCEPTEFKELKVPTINSFFNKNLFNTKFDLIILRHTLEHIKNPDIFIKDLEFIQKNNSHVFIEVPNLIYSLNNFIEDFTPDHVNYFYKDSLCKLFNKKIIKIDDEEYLYALFSNEDKKYESTSKIGFEELFINFNKNIETLTNNITSYNRVIFYGISNFYLWIYSRLQNNLKNKECFFIDDYIKDDNLNNLPKTSQIKEGDLVILCSSNKDIQNKMFNKIEEKNISVFFPWKEIVNV